MQYPAGGITIYLWVQYAQFLMVDIDQLDPVVYIVSFQLSHLPEA